MLIITIHKGLDIPMAGAAGGTITDRRDAKRYGVSPKDYVGLKVRVVVEEGQPVRKGDALMVDKDDERIRLTSPVDGKITKIARGERRQVEMIEIERCDSGEERTYDTQDLKASMLQSGLWAALKQRPFGIIPDPDDHPRDIFVSTFDSAPLAVDGDTIFKEERHREATLHGLVALTGLTDGKVYVGIDDASEWIEAALRGKRRFVFTKFEGKHPAGNVGVQISKTRPINKGERVWTMGIQDVITLGILAHEGKYEPERVVAICGPAASHPAYFRVITGVALEVLLHDESLDGKRIVSGNVLSGTQRACDSYLGAGDSQVTLLEEGDRHEFMGWIAPGLKKHSFSGTFLSGILPRLFRSSMRYNTGVHGGVRPLVMTGNFERVVPMDIYPLQLIKAAVIGDIELMEALGIYEVEPEDLALCEYIDPSKTEIQSIIRQALELCRKEGV